MIDLHTAFQACAGGAVALLALVNLWSSERPDQPELATDDQADQADQAEDELEPDEWSGVPAEPESRADYLRWLEESREPKRHPGGLVASVQTCVYNHERDFEKSNPGLTRQSLNPRFLASYSAFETELRVGWTDLQMYTASYRSDWKELFSNWLRPDRYWLIPSTGEILYVSSLDNRQNYEDRRFRVNGFTFFVLRACHGTVAAHIQENDELVPVRGTL